MVACSAPWIPLTDCAQELSWSVSIQNRTLPRMLPCGEPPEIFRGVDVILPMRTFIVLFVKKPAISETVTGSAPSDVAAFRHSVSTF